MKYSPSLPTKNDNISHNRPFSEFVLLCAGLASFFLIIYGLLGFFVDRIADSISYEKEELLFTSLNRYLDFEVDDESDERQRIQALVDSIQRCTKLPYPIKVHLVQSEEANALALPGGNIAVFTGLLSNIDSENGLAFILAHEFSHFENKDHLRSLGRGLVLFSLSTLLTGADSTLSNFLVPSTGLSQAQYSQSRESLADITALDTLHCHYGHVNGATEFFSNISTHENYESLKVMHYFSSHPHMQKRISDILQYSELQGYNQLPTQSVIEWKFP